jgi:hypothetical protein
MNRMISDFLQCSSDVTGLGLELDPFEELWHTRSFMSLCVKVVHTLRESFTSTVWMVVLTEDHGQVITNSKFECIVI